MLPVTSKGCSGQTCQSKQDRQHRHEGVKKLTSNKFPLTDYEKEKEKEKEKEIFCKILPERKVVLNGDEYVSLFPVKVKRHVVNFWNEPPESFNFFDANEKPVLFSRITDKNGYQMECEERIERVFRFGHESIIFTYDKEGVRRETKCHHFTNYIAFGLDRQMFSFTIEWYHSLANTKILPFETEKLHWGDIVLFLSRGNLVHSIFYLGDDKVIHKRGYGDQSLAITSLTEARRIYCQYRVDSFQVVRVVDQDRTNPGCNTGSTSGSSARLASSIRDTV